MPSYRPKKYCVKVGEYEGETFKQYDVLQYPTTCFPTYRKARNHAGKIRKALKEDDLKQLVLLEPID